MTPNIYSVGVHPQLSNNGHPVDGTFLTKLVTKVKPNINSVEVHPQLCNNGHPVDGAPMSADSLWPKFCMYVTLLFIIVPE